MLLYARRGVPLVGTLSLLFILTFGQASASILWCRADPTVSINGNQVDINVYSTEGIYKYVSGPTKVRIFVPEGVDTELISQDDGFGRGWKVTFATDDDLRVTARGVMTRVMVVVPADEELPVKAEIVDDGEIVASSVGETDERVLVKARL